MVTTCSGLLEKRRRGAERLPPESVFLVGCSGAGFFSGLGVAFAGGGLGATTAVSFTGSGITTL